MKLAQALIERADLQRKLAQCSTSHCPLFLFPRPKLQEMRRGCNPCSHSLRQGLGR